MPRTKNNKKSTESSLSHRKITLRWFLVSFVREVLPKRKWLRHAVYWLLAVIFFIFVGAYGIAQWYILSYKDKPLVVGATFIPDYARYFDLDPKETLQASINELGITDYRLVSYWKNHEKQPGQYDFSELDWQFDMVEQAGGTVSLAIGLRQPRWPECHGPDWAMALPQEVWQQRLKDYMGHVIDRYKDRDVLKSYQLENEYFLSVFGVCPDHSRERLIDEYQHVKLLDNTRPLVVSRSNNALPSWPVGEPRPDISAASIYKRVWDKTITKRYFEYPLPAWFYAFLAGGSKLTTGTNTIVHELQTEAWAPTDMDMRSAPIDELYKSIWPERLERMLYYGEATGMKRMDVWGIEWWYQLKTKRGEPEMWDTAARVIQELNSENPLGYDGLILE